MWKCSIVVIVEQILCSAEQLGPPIRKYTYMYIVIQIILFYRTLMYGHELVVRA